MNPVNGFPKQFFTPDVVESMSEPPPKYGPSDEENKKVLKVNMLAFNLIRYYWHNGRAIRDLSGKTILEVALGDVIALGETLDDRKDKLLQSKYHRITLSNIPDYTGLLIVIGLKIPNEPDVWASFVVWQADDSKTDGGLPLHHDELRTWIHRVFISTVLPPDRDVNSALREVKPSNVNLFLTTLSHCVKFLGMPPHFIASILEELLKNKTLMTTATLSNDSPAQFARSKDASKKKYLFQHSILI